MDQIKRLPLVIALFDGENDGGGGNEGAGDGAGAQGGAAQNDGAQQRNNRGQFSRNDGGNDRVYATDLTEANRRIAELNDESANRRRENKELKNQLSSVQSRQSLVDQRAIRMEAREWLREKGVIDADVVDLFLKHAGESIKIDEKTGDVVGVNEAGEKFKETKSVFFKAAESGASTGGDGSNNGASGDGSGKGNGTGADAGTGANAGGNGNADTRGNATGTGASVAGGGNSGKGGFQVANFRDSNVNADKAVDEYMKTLR